MVTFVLVLVLLIAVLVLGGFVLGYNKVRGVDVWVRPGARRIRCRAEMPGFRPSTPAWASIVGYPRRLCRRYSSIMLADAQAGAGRGDAGKLGGRARFCREAVRGRRGPRCSCLVRRGASELVVEIFSRNLQQNLADTEDKLAFARQYYNDAVATVNRLTTTIPWMFVAGMAGVKQREFYQVPK